VERAAKEFAVLVEKLITQAEAVFAEFPQASYAVRST
jgi:hypothetical protein